MKAWFQRIVAALLLAVGLACVCVPFRDYATDSVTVDTISVDVVGLAKGGTEASALWQVEGGEKGGEYAGILKGLDEIIDGDWEGGGMRLMHTTIEEASAFFPPDAEAAGESAFTCVYRDHVFHVMNASGWTARTLESTGSGMTPSLEVTMNVERRGVVVPTGDAVVLTKERMAERPRVVAFLDGIDSWDLEKDDYPSWTEWNALVEEAGGGGGGGGGEQERTRVVYGGRVLEVARDQIYAEVKAVVPGLSRGVKVAGVIFCLAGGLLLAALYRRPSEPGAIRVASSKYQFAGDLILILISAVAAVCVVDYLLGRWFDVDLLVNDEFGYLMSAFFLLVAVPLVSLYQTSAAAQYLWITEAGVRLKSLASDKRLAWDQLAGVRLKRVGMVTARAGVPMPRTLSRNLVLEGEAESLSIIEPSKEQKHLIIGELRKHAPEKWRENIDAMGEEWDEYVAW